MIKVVLSALLIFLSAACYAAEYGYVPQKQLSEDEIIEELQNSANKSKSKPPKIYVEDDEYDAMKGTKKRENSYTVYQKTRKALHMKPSKKIYYNTLDKSLQPITEDEYYKLSAEKIRKDFVIPEPEFEKEKDIILPDPMFRLIRYNTPPGQRNIDVGKLVSDNTAYSAGILSPDKTKMVYTQVLFYRAFSQSASAAYCVNIDAKSKDPYDILYQTNIVQGNPTSPLFRIGMDEIINRKFVTLVPVDWSKDSQKIAFKEKIGSNAEGTWQTNVIIYDFPTKKMKRLNAVKEAVIYYWRHNGGIELKDYLWDIFPVGWDKNNPERLIIYAYAFTAEKPLFLGTWSIDFNNEESRLESINSTDAKIDLNGFGLKEVRLSH